MQPLVRERPKLRKDQAPSQDHDPTAAKTECQENWVEKLVKESLYRKTTNKIQKYYKN